MKDWYNGLYREFGKAVCSIVTDNQLSGKKSNPHSVGTEVLDLFGEMFSGEESWEELDPQ